MKKTTLEAECRLKEKSFSSRFNAHLFDKKLEQGGNSHSYLILPKKQPPDRNQNNSLISETFIIWCFIIFGIKLKMKKQPEMHKPIVLQGFRKSRAVFRVDECTAQLYILQTSRKVKRLQFYWVTKPLMANLYGLLF